MIIEILRTQTQQLKTHPVEEVLGAVKAQGCKYQKQHRKTLCQQLTEQNTKKGI